MPTSKFAQVDTTTGELIEGFVAVVQPRRKNGFSTGGWFALAQEAMTALMGADLTGRDYHVLFGLLARLDYENLIQISQAELAQSLGMQRPHVARSIRKLINMGAILEGPKIGRSRSYRLNPNLGWKGSAKNHQEALKDRMRAAGMSVVEIDRDTQTIDWVNGKSDNEKE